MKQTIKMLNGSGLYVPNYLISIQFAVLVIWQRWFVLTQCTMMLVRGLTDANGSLATKTVVVL